MRSIQLILTLTFIASPLYAQKFDELARTPPMGWNSWNTFACDIDEQLIRDIADSMVQSGMRDAGYVYLNLDDCWHGTRDSLGFIRPDPERFPSGMQALGEYIHSRGLKFGIYSDAGYTTCGGRPGSRGYEYQDALTYAGWGVDYLKHDWCDTDGLAARGAYMTMRDAIAKAGRPIVLSICEWGDNQPWEWAQDVGHLWRTTGDIYACFDCVVDHGTWKSWGVLQILDMQEGLRKHAGPGHWNDPDMMQVGNLASANEDRAHFSMWAMLAAPLIAGNDLRDMDPGTLAILTNRDVIAVNQDILGIQGFPYSRQDGLEIWFKPLMDGDWAMAILNRSDEARQVQFDWSSNAVVDPDFGHELRLDDHRYVIRDLWSDGPATVLSDTLEVSVSSRDVAMYRLISDGE